MREIVTLLAQGRSLYLDAARELDSVREALKRNTSGTGVSAAVHRIEPILSALSELNKKTEELLAARKAKDLYELLTAQPDSADRDVALRLFADTERLRDKVKRNNALTNELLQRSKMFVDFHINVASQVKAENTYGPPGTAENIKQGRKVFVADA